ncbi:MAG: hypothetical protein EA397_09580 [Deltaproteobacteria bacterium]|nr:MAG: hypothetical protein EA397_09580 [Deltaproteobacteria bacterium]
MSPSLRGPSEGIVASSSPPGWAAQAWMAIFDGIRETHHGQLARGRSLARGGRVRELWFSPSIVGAEISDGGAVHTVRLRVDPFTDDQWERVIARLTEQISRIAALLEGELPESLVTTLHSDGLPLLPSLDQLEGDCDCDDFRLPCCHMAAAHNLVADALDGDPFLLLTLRGLDRDQLLRRVRKAWGDPTPLVPPQAEPTAPPPRISSGWTTSPVALPKVAFHLAAKVESLAGLQALGPPPGGDELVQALEPLYLAGSEAARESAYESRRENTTQTDRWRGFKRGRSAPAALTQAVKEAQRPPLQPDEAVLIRHIVDHLANHGPSTTAEISDRIGEPRDRVIAQIEALATLGLTYRISGNRSQRWALG